jgi:hypothetical protein
LTIFSISTTAHHLDHTRSDAYFAERVAGTDDARAAAYRSAREHLRSYPSAILFPEHLLLLPVCDLRRKVWAVDFEVVADKEGGTAFVGSKVRRLEFFDLAAEHDLAMIYATPEEVIEADRAGIHLSLCRRLPWLDNAYDPVARLRLYLPCSLIHCVGAWPGFALDALFADRSDALQYQATTNQRIWSRPSVVGREIHVGDVAMAPVGVMNQPAIGR